MSDITKLLNDQQLNLLADLYLDHLALDKRSLSYRRIKNAVLLIAQYCDDVKTAYSEIAKAESVTPAEIEHDINAALSSLSAPIDELFNSSYCPNAEVGFMPRFAAIDDAVSFLGKTFLYILETNYREYRNSDR